MPSVAKMSTILYLNYSKKNFAYVNEPLLQNRAAASFKWQVAEWVLDIYYTF